MDDQIWSFALDIIKIHFNESMLMKKTLYDIKVTFSLLHKPESELTKLEKEAIARYKDD